MFNNNRFQIFLIPFFSLLLGITIPLLSIVLIWPLFASQPLLEDNKRKKNDEDKNTKDSTKTEFFNYPIHQPHDQNDLNPHKIYQWEAIPNQKSNQENSN